MEGRFIVADGHDRDLGVQWVRLDSTPSNQWARLFAQAAGGDRVGDPPVVFRQHVL